MQIAFLMALLLEFFFKCIIYKLLKHAKKFKHVCMSYNPKCAKKKSHWKSEVVVIFSKII